MTYDNALIAEKLRRWERYMNDYRLPHWDEIPDIGLYMEQVITLLKQYLDYLPPELKEEQFITAATINNYVRKKIMPPPIRKKYYRYHIAYLLVICSLKQSLSIPTLQTLVPYGLSLEALKERYSTYCRQLTVSIHYFVEQVRLSAGAILEHENATESEFSASDTTGLILFSAIVSGFSRLLAEKLLLLEGKTAQNGASPCQDSASSTAL